MSGSLTHSPVEIMEQLFSDLSLGTLASSAGSWPIFRDVMPDGEDLTDNVIHLHQTEPQISHKDHQFNVWEREGFQAIVRSDGSGDGRDKIEAIKTSLDAVKRRTVTIGANTYLMHSVRRVSGPVSIGQESGGRRSLFSLNGVMQVRQTT